MINHEGISAYLDLGITVQGRSIPAVANDVDAIVHKLAYPVEYHAEVLTDYTAAPGSPAAPAHRLDRRFSRDLPAFAGFRQKLDDGVCHLPAPARSAGRRLADRIPDEWRAFVASLFGLLAVLGIAARNAIALINHYQHLEMEKGGRVSVQNWSLRGSAEQSCPNRDDHVDDSTGASAFCVPGQSAPVLRSCARWQSSS